MRRAPLIIVISVLSLFVTLTGCSIFSGDTSSQDIVVKGEATISGTVFKGVGSPSLRAVAGSLPVVGARVWLEERPDLNAITDAEGRYVITSVPSGAFQVVARVSQGGTVFKMRSVVTSITANQNRSVDISVFEAKNRVSGILTDEDGEQLPPGTKLWLWGEEFEVEANGRFTTPPLPDFDIDRALNNIVVNLGSANQFSMPAAFVSSDQPVEVEFVVPATPASAAQMPKISLLAIHQNRTIAQTDSETNVTVRAIVSPATVANTDISWLASRGLLSDITTGGTSAREKIWTAPGFGGLATLSVSLTYSNKTVTARIPIMVNGPVPNSVTYSGNGQTGGSVPVDSARYGQSSIVTVLGNTGGLTRTGYTFIGWNSQADGRGNNFVENSTLSMGAVDMIFYANWDPNRYNVTFNSNGGSGVHAQIVRFGANIGRPDNPTKEGQAFVGWYKDSALTNLWDFDSDMVTSALTLFAKWSDSQSYVVTFNSNKGTDVGTQTVVLGAKLVEPSAPTRKGFAFGGWFKDAALTTKWNFDTDVVESDLSLYAKWFENSYTVVFASNGGSSVVNQIVVHQGKVNLPEQPTRVNFIFTGWYKEATLETLWNFDLDLVASDMTLHASWKSPETRKVTFNSNGGSDVSAQNVLLNEKVTEPPVPSLEGHMFAGWYKEDSLLSRWNFASDIVTDDISLYAKWDANTYSVSFDSNGGSAVTMQTVSHGQKAFEPISMTRQGHSFAGWYKEASLANPWNFEEDLVVAAVTLYAKWQIKSFEVSFDTGAGSTIATQTIEFDKLITEPAEPILPGYVFSGWYKDSEHTQVWNFDIDRVEADMTIYAKWTAMIYEVIFVTNGGSSVEVQSVAHNEKIIEPGAPTRAGYFFAGWYKESGLTNLWNFDTDVVESEVTLYAKWSDSLTYVVSFDSNGGTAVGQQTVAAGAKLPEPAAPTKAGYFFAGWFKDAVLTTKWKFDTDIVESDLSLYAKWILTESPVPDGYTTAAFPAEAASVVVSGFESGKEMLIALVNRSETLVSNVTLTAEQGGGVSPSMRASMRASMSSSLTPEQKFNLALREFELHLPRPSSSHHANAPMTSIRADIKGDTVIFKAPTANGSGIDYEITAKAESVTAIPGTGYNLNIYVDTADTHRWLEAYNTAIASAWNDRIYPRNTAAFGPDPKKADLSALLNDDITIVFTSKITGSTAGFFWSGDFYDIYPASDGRKMFYMQIPATIDDDFAAKSLSTIAHEFQHMIFAGQKIKFADEINFDDKWLNEAMSGYAEYINDDRLSTDLSKATQVRMYLDTVETNNLLDWSNSFEDYGQVYLFGIWLGSHYGTSGSVAGLLSQASRGKAAIEAFTGESFDVLFAQFALAMAVNDHSGSTIYGVPETDLEATYSVSGSLPVVLTGVNRTSNSGVFNYSVPGVAIESYAAAYVELTGGNGSDVNLSLPAGISTFQLMK